jgi:hypothetical protein
MNKYSEKELEDNILFFDESDWKKISWSQKLSEEFIEKHSDKVYWLWISAYQNLSEAFIEKYSDKVDWIDVSERQKLSEQFIEKHKDKIKIDLLIHNKNISNKIKEEIRALMEII